MLREKNGRVYKTINMLPHVIEQAVKEFLYTNSATVYEIHLRAESYQSITTDTGVFVLSDKMRFVKNTTSPFRVSKKELSDTVINLCDGSVYTHFEELKNGYITVDGTRVGICGNMICESGNIKGFSSYSSLNIRFPHHVKWAADDLFKEFDKYGCKALGGILVISPPGVGKTTFLRALASGISGGFYDLGTYCTKSCCVVDERSEIYLSEAFGANMCDFISGIPKALCISHLTRTMTPQYIFCDEIADRKEAQSIYLAASHGISFAASVHGETVEDVMKKPKIAPLIKSGVFSTACELYTENGKRLCRIRKNIS